MILRSLSWEGRIRRPNYKVGTLISQDSLGYAVVTKNTQALWLKKQRFVSCYVTCLSQEVRRHSIYCNHSETQADNEATLSNIASCLTEKRKGNRACSGFLKLPPDTDMLSLMLT